MSRLRLALIGAVGVVVVASFLFTSTTREVADDLPELTQQVEYRIDGAVIHDWTLTTPSCPVFPSIDVGTKINCTAVANDPSGRQRTANVAVRIASCDGAVLSTFLGQDDTRDCTYDYTYTIHQGAAGSSDA